MNKITIKDVAKEAGVSIATVSKALNDVDVVKPETKKRVLDAVKNLYYIPNLMGKQLKSGQTKLLGFYTTSVSGPYFNVLVESIAREAERHGYGINVFVSTDKQVVLNSIMGNLVDGIIGFEDLITEEDLQAMKRENIKAVFVDRNIEAEFIGSVVFDSYQKGYEATEHLLRLGHTNIAYIAGYDGVFDNEERKRGYQQALADHGVAYDPDNILHGLFEEEGSYNAVRTFMRQRWQDHPTAFLAGNDLSAIGAIKALKVLGLEVPQDISIVGFDDIELLEYFTPQLTTVHNPIARQGTLAVEHLLELINEEQPGHSYELSGELIIRSSTSVP